MAGCGVKTRLELIEGMFARSSGKRRDGFRSIQLAQYIHGEMGVTARQLEQFRRWATLTDEQTDALKSIINQVVEIRAVASKLLLEEGRKQAKVLSQRNAENREVLVGKARLEMAIAARRNDEKVKRPEVRWKEDLAHRLDLSAYRHLKPKLEELDVTEAWIADALRRKE
jgi:hypothetical protein